MKRHLSIRVRLAFLWAGLFLLTGVLLLTAANVAMMAALDRLAAEVPDRLAVEFGDDVDRAELGAALEQLTAADGRALDALREPVQRAAASVRATTLVALVGLTVVSGGLGWWLAGRMLAPVSAITATARRISDTNLAERIDATGPRDELRELADALDAMLARLERSFEAQRAFAADASHELRTPLTLIRAEVDVTLDDPHVTPAEVAEAASSIRRALGDSEDLIERLLQLASAAAIHDRHPVPLAPLVEASLATHLADTPHGPLRLRTDLQPVSASGDPTLVARLIDNLVHNAVRHNRPDGDVEVSVGPQDDHARLVVANSGAPLTAEERARLTDRFYRPDPSRARSTGGHGLGLAIVDAVVRAHHGRLRLDRVDGGGLRVEVLLPLAPEPGQDQSR